MRFAVMGNRRLVLVFMCVFVCVESRFRRSAVDPKATDSAGGSSDVKPVAQADVDFLNELLGDGYKAGPSRGQPAGGAGVYQEPCSANGGLVGNQYPQVLPPGPAGKPGTSQPYPQTVPGGPGGFGPGIPPSPGGYGNGGGFGQGLPPISPGKPGGYGPGIPPVSPGGYNQGIPPVSPGGPGGYNPGGPGGYGKGDPLLPPGGPGIGGPGKLPSVSPGGPGGYGQGIPPVSPGGPGGYGKGDPLLPPGGLGVGGPGKLPAGGYGQGIPPVSPGGPGSYGPGGALPQVSPPHGAGGLPSGPINPGHGYLPSKPSKYEVDIPNPKCEYPYDCVPFYLCQDGFILDTGEGIIDVRKNLDDEEKLIGGNCPNYLDVCCQQPDTQGITTPKPSSLFQPRCGRRNELGIGARILFKNQSYEAETQFGEFPWMAAILKTQLAEPDSKGHREEYDVYQCGGSLIHPQVILTAAHCVEYFRNDPQPLKVRLGEWDTQRDEYEPYPHEDRRVTKVILSEKFRPGTLFNDIALLFLDEPAELYHHIDTICLPEYGQSFEGSYCTVTGWGKNNFGKAGSYQEVLKRIDVPMVNNYDCQHALRNTKLGKYFRLHPSFICAGGEPEKDACKGDGGSPLVCFDKYRESYVQVGIVAWGIGCGQGGIPGVYADVVQQADWINDMVTKYLSLGVPYWDLRSAAGRSGGSSTDAKKEVEAKKDEQAVKEGLK